MIATDFSNVFDFRMTKMAEYQKIVLMTAMPLKMKTASAVAVVILKCNRWENQLRYDDAKTLVANRQHDDDIYWRY
jgi:hypothetical protein